MIYLAGYVVIVAILYVVAVAARGRGIRIVALVVALLMTAVAAYLAYIVWRNLQIYGLAF